MKEKIIFTEIFS